jgi:hypothetical protein
MPVSAYEYSDLFPHYSDILKYTYKTIFKNKNDIYTDMTSK